MRKLVVVALMVALGLAACGSDDKKTEATNTTAGDNAAASAPVKLSGTVNEPTTMDATGKTSLEVEADDFYFKPNFIKMTSGQKLTIELKNEGKATHTFTSPELGVDQELKPDSTATVEITMPSADAVAFYCRFHQGGGMQGAVFTKEGATVGGASTGTTASTSSNGY